MFQKLDLFQSSGEGRETPTEATGNSSSFWNVVFRSYLFFRKMDPVEKSSDSEIFFGLESLQLHNSLNVKKVKLSP
jgi:hypothetical protein